ncbi:MAG TPA: hypothetical protein DD979_03070 [Gammaproteobacteria bacterium]|nr:hypothetical protein [Gammaproteobacteria bacterium]
MALKNRVRTAMPETHSHRHTQSFWLYRLEGLLLAAAPIVAVAGVIAVQAGQPAGQVVLLCALAMFGLVALRYWVLASAMDRVFNAAYAAGLRMRSGLLQHLTRLPMGRFRTLHTGKVAQILSEDITWIETWVSHHWPMSQSDTLLMLTLLVGAAVLNPAMAVAAVLTFAVGMAVLCISKNTCSRAACNIAPWAWRRRLGISLSLRKVCRWCAPLGIPTKPSGTTTSPLRSCVKASPAASSVTRL